VAWATGCPCSKGTKGELKAETIPMILSYPSALCALAKFASVTRVWPGDCEAGEKNVRLI